MDNLDHQKTTVSTGYDGHEFHLCHRCGWPFPNPHPSSRHRRAHKRVCGTVESYEIIQLKSEDHNLAFSDDEHTSDEDEHTPSPTVEKKIASIGGVGGNSNRSEDDVFSDAITEFSDGGISPQLKEHFEQLKGIDTSLEQKTIEGDSSESLLKKTDETADPTEELNGPPITDLVDAKDQSENVSLITDTKAEPISLAHNNGLILKPDFIRSEIQKDESIDINELGDKRIELGLVKAKQDADILKEEEKLASVTLESEDAKTLDLTSVSVEQKKVPCENLVGEVVKHDLSSLTETLEHKDATSEVNDVANSVEVSGPTITSGHIESIDASVGITEKYVQPGNENGNWETKDEFSGEIVLNPFYAETSFTPNNDKSEVTSLKEDMNHCDEKSEINNELGKAATIEVPAILDSVMKSVNSTISPSSCEVDINAKHLEEESRTEVNLVEYGDNGHQKSLQELDTAIKGVESVDNPGIVSELKHNGDIIESERTVHPIANESAPLLTYSEMLSESSANEKSVLKDVAIESECVDTAKTGTKLNQDGNVVILSEKAESSTLKIMQEAKILNQEPYVEEGHTCDGNAVKSEKCSFTPNLNEPLPLPLDVQVQAECPVTSDENGKKVENVCVDSKSLQNEGDVKLTEEHGISAEDLSGEHISRSDSLEAKCGSVLSDKSETYLQAPKTVTEECHPDKSDIFEPPSFMTLVQPGDHVNQITIASEIETVQNNQQAGWFPSLTSVVNESEGRKKNEEIISKVSQGKQHGPLKKILNEAKSHIVKPIPIASQKDEVAVKDNGTVAVKNQAGSKEMGKEWDSPARYPMESKKEKRKKGYWVPFVCCSSVHQDL